MGTIATVLQLLKLPDGTVKVLVEETGARRLSGSPIKKFSSKLKPKAVADNDAESEEVEALTRTVVAEFEQYIKLNKGTVGSPHLGQSDRRCRETSRYGRATPLLKNFRQAGTSRDRGA